MSVIVQIILLGATAPLRFASFAQMDAEPTSGSNGIASKDVNIHSMLNENGMGDHIIQYADEISTFVLNSSQGEFLEECLAGDNLSKYEAEALPFRTAGLTRKTRSELSQKQKIELLIREKAMSVQADWIERIQDLGGEVNSGNVQFASDIYKEYYQAQTAKPQECFVVDDYASNHYYLFNAKTTDTHASVKILDKIQQVDWLCIQLAGFYKDALLGERRFLLTNLGRNTYDVRNMKTHEAHLLYWNAEHTMNGSNVAREYDSDNYSSSEDEETKMKEQLFINLFKLSFENQVNFIKWLADADKNVYTNKKAFHLLLDAWHVDRHIVDVLISSENGGVTSNDKENRKAFLKYIIDRVQELVSESEETTLQDKGYDFHKNSPDKEKYYFAIMATVVYGIWTSKKRSNKDRYYYTSNGSRKGWRHQITSKLGFTSDKEATRVKSSMYNFMQFVTGLSRAQENEKKITKTTMFGQVKQVAATNPGLYKASYL